MVCSAVSVDLKIQFPAFRTSGAVAVVKSGILRSTASGAAAIASPVETGPITMMALSRVAIRLMSVSASCLSDRLSSTMSVTLVAPKKFAATISSWASFTALITGAPTKANVPVLDRTTPIFTSCALAGESANAVAARPATVSFLARYFIVCLLQF